MVAKTKAEKKRNKEAQAAWIAQQSSSRREAAEAAPTARKDVWVRWTWSRERNCAVRQIARRPQFMWPKGQTPARFGFVVEGTIDEIEQRENCGQKDFFADFAVMASL